MAEVFKTDAKLAKLKDATLHLETDKSTNGEFQQFNNKVKV